MTLSTLVALAVALGGVGGGVAAAAAAAAVGVASPGTHPAAVALESRQPI